MRKPITRWIAPLAVLALALTACEDGGPTEVADDLSIEFKVVSGTAQEALAGAELGEPLVVKVERWRGWGRRKHKAPKAHHLVNFVVVEGGGSVFAGAAMTSWKGIAQDWWTLGPEPGLNVLEVRAVDPYTGDKKVYATFTAIGLCEPVDNVTVTPQDPADDLFLLAGEQVQLTALLQNADGETLTGCAVEWESSNEDVATVDENGLVTAPTVVETEETVTITATSQGTSGSAEVTVGPPPVFSVQILDSDGVAIDQFGIIVGAAVELTARLEDEQGNPLSRNVTWTWSDLSGGVVTLSVIDNVATVTAVESGAVTVTATSGDASDAVIVAVNEPAGPPFEVNNTINTAWDLGEITEGQTRQFFANFPDDADATDYYKLRAVETLGLACDPAVGDGWRLTIELTEIPDGRDYDLYFYDKDKSLKDWSENGAFPPAPPENTPELIDLPVGPNPGPARGCGQDDSFDFFVEVYPARGDPTSQLYELTVTFERVQ